MHQGCQLRWLMAKRRQPTVEIQSLAAALAQVGAAEDAKDRGNRQHGVPVH